MSGLDDGGALNLDTHRGQRRSGRTVHYRAIGDTELAAVAWAVDGAAGHGGDRAALMGHTAVNTSNEPACGCVITIFWPSRQGMLPAARSMYRRGSCASIARSTRAAAGLHMRLLTNCRFDAPAAWPGRPDGVDGSRVKRLSISSARYRGRCPVQAEVAKSRVRLQLTGRIWTAVRSGGPVVLRSSTLAGAAVSFMPAPSLRPRWRAMAPAPRRDGARRRSGRPRTSARRTSRPLRPG